MNLEGVLDPEYGLQQDEWSLSKPRFGDEGQLEVIGWSGKYWGKKLYILNTPDGYIRITKAYLFISKFVDVVLDKKAKTIKDSYEFNISPGKSVIKLSCKYCERKFVSTNKLKIYCSDICKVNWHKKNNHSYTKKQRKIDRELDTAFKSFIVQLGVLTNRDIMNRGVEYLRKWTILCGTCGQSYKQDETLLLKGKRLCGCGSTGPQQLEAYINLLQEADTVVAIKFGISQDSQHRIKAQDRQSAYTLKQHSVYSFPSVQQCKKAERECKQQLECGVVLKRDMPDGYSETTWAYNIGIVKDIYERNGGVLVG